MAKSGGSSNNPVVRCALAPPPERRRVRTTARVLIVAALLGAATEVGAQSTPSPNDLSLLTLEELLNIRITSASRKEQTVKDTPAAVFVLTQEDIRRSGMTTLPELFRLVPGMTVSHINSNNWAISVRGLGSLFTNKLLVLIDGRSIYNRTFSGVYWSSQNLMLDDIDRIEIIRGPGGSMWGANAVNGVINIITKAAGDTHGALVRVGTGTQDPGQAAIRYGGSFGATSYRVYSQWSDHGGSVTDRSTTADDSWHAVTAGFRVDRTKGADAITAEGSFTSLLARPMWFTFSSPAPGPASTEGTARTHDGTLLGRWTHTRATGSALQVQSFVDHHYADNPAATEIETVVDIDVQYHTHLGARHDVVFGGGYRYANLETIGSFTYSLTPPINEGRVVNAFMQDDIALGRRVRVTLGSKMENDITSGWSVQPTARALWKVTPETQQAWAAISRAVRTPSAQDLAVRIIVASFAGDAGFLSWWAWSATPTTNPSRSWTSRAATVFRSDRAPPWM
jgi:iron complex outermembrane recepter protein